jgi:hypothetical protein
MVMNSINSKFAVAVFASFFALGVGKLQARECSNATYEGDYAFTNIGQTQDIVGIYTADGNGNIVGSQTRVNVSSTVRETYTETYTVNPDCTGSTEKVTSSGFTLHYDFVINRHGTKIRSIQTDPGVLVTSIAEQQ